MLIGTVSAVRSKWVILVMKNLSGDRILDILEHPRELYPQTGPEQRKLRSGKPLPNRELPVQECLRPINQLLLRTLLPDGDFNTGEVGMWLQVRNVPLERVLRLDNLKRLSASTDAADGSIASRWPLQPSTIGNVEQMIGNMLDSMLERSGYRQIRVSRPNPSPPQPVT